MEYGPGLDASPIRAPSFQLWEVDSRVLVLVLVLVLMPDSVAVPWCALVHVFFQLLERALVCV